MIQLTNEATGAATDQRGLPSVPGDFKKPWASLVVSLLFVWGIAYETAFFKFLDQSAAANLGWLNFVVSGLQGILPPFATVFLFTQLRKFWTKSIDDDDAKLLEGAVSKIQFAEALNLARLAFVVACLLGIGLLVFSQYVETTRFANLRWYLVWTVIGWFVPALASASKRSFYTIWFMLLISSSVLAFGLGDSDSRFFVFAEDNRLREDWVVTIHKMNGKLVVEPTVPPLISRIISFLDPSHPSES